MDISRKSGIKTVKHTKVNEELFQMISQESAKFAGGMEEFQREAYARYFEKQPEKPVIISFENPMFHPDRTRKLSGNVSIDTEMFFVNVMNETGEQLENVVGELLTRFTENPANIPTIIRKPVTIDELVMIDEPVTMDESEPVETKLSVEFDTIPEPVKLANILEINLDELLIKSVIEDLQKFGFDETKYLSLEAENSTRKTFEAMMIERIAQKDRIIESLRDGANPTEAMKQGFKGLLDFAVILYNSHLDRNGLKGIFTKISKEHMMELCPAELKHFFE